jgi:hypothetical protein
LTRPSNTKKRQPEPTFFIDRNLSGGSFVAHLRLNGIRVEELEAHFPETAEDVEWLRLVGNNGWVAVTQDQLRDDLEAQVALMQHGAKVVVFMGFLPHHELAGLFLRKYKRIKKMIETIDEPFMAKIYVKTAEISVVTLADLYRTQARRRR